MSKIKIAHCMCGLHGGVSNVILNYFDHMPLEDYEIHILSNDISSELYTKHYEERGFKIIQIPRVGRHPFRSLKTIRNIMKENGYDIVHCHMTLTSIFPLWSAKRAGIKVRVSHSHMVTDPKKSMKDRVLTFINHKFSRSLATDLMACGRDAGRSLFGVKNDFTVLNNAIRLSEYASNDEVRISEREKLGVGDRFVIGHVGRFTNQKNHSYMLDIFRAFHDKHPESVLLLIGEGELMDDVKQKAAQLGITDSVIYTGAVNDVPKKLQAMDLFLLPSLSEGLPVVAVEAQAAGLPCVISENVTREVKVLDEVSYVSLDKKPEEWAEVIEQYISVPRRKAAEELLSKSGYCIGTEAEKLDGFYKKSVCKNINEMR